MRRISIYWQLALTFLFFLAIALVYRGSGLDNNLDKILSLSTFLFAIDLGFSTANRKARMDSIRSQLRHNDATILSIYEESKNMGQEVNDGVRSLLDELLVAQIDYALVDFDKTTPQLIKLIEYINGIKATGEREEFKKRLVANGEQLVNVQKELAYWLSDKMMLFEWISLLTFGSIMVFCAYSLSNGSLLTNIVLPLAATAMALLVYVVRDINNLRWQEENWIWNRLIELFQELDLKPYILDELFHNGRLSTKKLDLTSEYRLVKYTHPYPDFSDKKISIVKTS